MSRRASSPFRHPAALLLLALLFGWQSLASAMALPCRFQAQPPAPHSMATKLSHEAPAHAGHCPGMKPQVKLQHDCDGLCADHHCAGVAFALPPTLAASAEPPLAHVDALFIAEPLRNGSSSELIRPPSRS
ncbi:MULTISPECIES: hypothetical protein [Hydrocarboniphaga]|uniref:Uncharacterized protein n=2 Tax=Hydrocarboniphaga effusa TaxID=243629 RepID=I8TA29_9GAMM|nr:MULTISPECIES: hypothetical protein [Hydrocarboniphaga]EIT70505.1 hypothetical protein WQQ_06420 [Hydrocarboniphaga effusa AP103]